MILQALVGFYEQLAKEHPEKIARVGWCSRQVAFMLVLSSEANWSMLFHPMRSAVGR